MTNLYLLALCVAILVILPAQSQFQIKGSVKKRNTIIKLENSFSSKCYNGSVLDKGDSLKRIVYSSRFIFTGKITRVRTRKREKRSVFRVLVRRVLKGDISVLSDLLNFETGTSNSSRAYVIAKGGNPLGGLCSSHGWAAILFGERLSSPFQLLVDPVPLTLERVRRVRSVIKGRTSTIL
ncbi:unnamed protein product [Leptosia nina]|uniref:Uncharacterized protein n=1 Tax=Leptosia nina TaxID=320188 RepID=A0AAV1ISH2_9NEOP